MSRATVAAIGVALLAASCGPPAGEVPPFDRSASSGNCVALFQEFDILYRRMSTRSGRLGGMSVSPEVQRQGNAISQAGCLSYTRDLTGLDSTGGTVSDSGPIVVPISVHAGVVTNMNDEARAIAFFEERGVRVRTIGNAALGRRIYLGPFQTQGALDDAIALSRQAGFVAPYPAKF
jgi:hypothetical protein